MYILIRAFTLSKYSKVLSNAATFALSWNVVLPNPFLMELFYLYKEGCSGAENGWHFAALKGGESLPAKPSLVPVGCRDTLEMNPHHFALCFIRVIL